MASKVVAIAQSQAALQLGLTGLKVHETQDPAAVEKLLGELLESDTHVVIVDEAFRNAFSEWFDMKLARHSGLPLVIFVPSFNEEDPGTDAYINAILKPAVGFEIRLD